MGLLLTAAPPAFAARTYDSQITGFTHPAGIAIDGHEDVWISEEGQEESRPITEYGPYPSQTKIGEQKPGGHFGADIRSIAVGHSPEILYVADSGPVDVDLFEPPNGAFKERWEFGNSCGVDSVAVDNSGGPSQGRVYLARTCGPEQESLNLQAFTAAHAKANFTGMASYIHENQITGTPTGPHGEVVPLGRITNVATDSHGNLYLVDPTNKVIDEFNSEGTFLRDFTGAGAPEPFSAERSELTGVAVDPTNGDVLIVDAGADVIDEFSSAGEYLGRLTGTESQSFVSLETGGIAVNSEGYVYVSDLGAEGSGGFIDIFTPVLRVTYHAVTHPTSTSGTLNATVEPSVDGSVTECEFEYDEKDGKYNLGKVPCSPNPAEHPPSSNFSVPTEVSAELKGLKAEITYHYRVVVHHARGKGAERGVDQTYTPHHVFGLQTEESSGLKGTSATLNGSFVGSEEEAHYYFEWGTTTAYGEDTAVPPGVSAGSPSGPGRTALSFGLSNLEPVTTYHYRIVAENHGGTSDGEDRSFTTTTTAPLIDDSVTEVHSDRALLQARINPGGLETTYRFEYGAAACSATPDPCAATPLPIANIGSSNSYQSLSTQLSELQPGTIYHYRVIATNAESPAGGTLGPERTFTTFPFLSAINDPCPNSHARQQTGAALLLDCRAYELVSAPNTNGYDVESNLISGQSPFAGYPQASGASGASRLLYGVHDGGIPGTGHPTNRGLDPYIATRGPEGWSTEYVGIPADGTPSTVPFASTLQEADAGLGTFAFGGSEICSPCFDTPGTTEVGFPIHLPDGKLVQGMAGSISQSAAQPAGYVAKDLSADGSHFVFGSTSQFAVGGNSNGTEPSIYDRNLKTEETHVVSKLPDGASIPCLTNCSSDGIGELDVSSDGSHVLLGQLVEEKEGAKYWHLYMNVGDSGGSIELTPAATEGVVYDGMSSDGSKVFFSSAQHLTNEDTEHSGADIYMWSQQGEAEGHPLSLISKAGSGSPTGAGNTDSCDPASNTGHPHWNSAGSEANCGMVALGGGGGVAATDGTVYFLSPELLDGSENGTPNAPNLYVSRPGMSPHFVATLESSANAALPPSQHAVRRSFGSFIEPGAVAITDAAGEEGDSYVFDLRAGGEVRKFDASDQSVVGFGNEGTINGSGCITEVEGGVGPIASFNGHGLPAAIAVDNDPASASYRDLYVPDMFASLVDKFSPEGRCLAQIPTPYPTGAAVDPATGDLYVTNYVGSAGVSVFDPKGEPKSIYPNPRFGEPGEPELISSFETISRPAGIAVDSRGTVYVINSYRNSGGGRAAVAYDSETGKLVRQLEVPANQETTAVSVDISGSAETNRSFDHVYLTEAIGEGPERGNSQVLEFDSSGNQVGSPIGSGLFPSNPDQVNSTGGEGPGALGLAAAAGRLLITAEHIDSSQVTEFAPRALPPDGETDNPLVLDSVSTPETRHTADFQVSPSGNDAVFTSTLSLTGYDSASHREVFRYDSPTETLTCVSCNQTAEQASGEATLATNGLSLTDNGRVFFNSTEGLVDRDLNEREDVYEWEPAGSGPEKAVCHTATGCLDLLSPGTSPFASSLLSASSDGTDAFFFTRSPLVNGDQNGSRVRIYDAREEGGFPFIPPPVPCKASDECHGAGSSQPPPPNIQSVAPSPGGNEIKPTKLKCKANFVKKHGECVKKSRHRRKHHQPAARHHRGS